MSLLEFLEKYKAEKEYVKFFTKIRFRNGKYCPHCRKESIYQYADGKLYKCADCRKQFTIKVGTIFEGSKLSIDKWFTGSKVFQVFN